jgi:hypothetical protein
MNTASELPQILRRNMGLMTSPPVATPCNHFPDGPLLGNGDLTVVSSGTGDLQSFHIGKSDFWTDGVGFEMTNEEYDNYVLAPVTLGSVRLWIRDFACPTYRQEIDIGQAEVRGRFTSQGSTVVTRSWVAAGGNFLFLELTLEGAAPVGVHLRTEAKMNDDPGNAKLPTAAGIEEDSVIWAERETWDLGRFVSRGCIALRVFGTTAGSRWSRAGRHSSIAIVLQPGETVCAAVAVAGGRDATTHRQDAITRLRALSPHSIEVLRRDHRQWWSAYWSRSHIDLGGDIIERYWYGAQYALACCSRSGHTCPGLFGFSTHDHPRWNGDYHLNYNAEHPFAGVFSSNRAELADPYIDAINAFIPEGRIRAGRDIRPPMPGVYFPIGLGPWGTVAQDSYMSQKCAAAYAAWPHIERFYHHPEDDTFTREKIYPLCKAAGEFWDAYLTDEDGVLHIKGSASHEHGGHDLDANFDLPLVRRLFLALIAMSDRLGIDADLRPRWRDVVSRLARYPTIEHEGRQHFREAANCPKFTRSISLYNVIWPGAGDVGLWGDKNLLDAARNTLRSLALWDQGNSFSWIFPAAVRVGLPDVYERLARRLEAHDGLRPNLTVAQAYGGIETFGTTAAVNEMLVQSYTGVIHLFPAWPRNRDAAFSTLRTYGGHLVSAALRSGTVQDVTLITSPSSLPSTPTTPATPARLASPWPEGAVARLGGSVVARSVDGLIELPATPKTAYSITQS